MIEALLALSGMGGSRRSNFGGACYWQSKISGTKGSKLLDCGNLHTLRLEDEASKNNQVIETVQGGHGSLFLRG